MTLVTASTPAAPLVAADEYHIWELFAFLGLTRKTSLPLFPDLIT